MDETRDDQFVEVFVQNQQSVYAFIVTQLPDRNDADEVFQQTNVILLKKWRDYDRATPYYSWACGVAHNEVRNYLRRQQRRPARLSDEMLALVAHTSEEMESALQQRLSRLEDCLERLSPEQRTLIEQCYLTNETIQAVAEQIKVKPNTLYKRLERIRRMLLACVMSSEQPEGRP